MTVRVVRALLSPLLLLFILSPLPAPAADAPAPSISPLLRFFEGRTSGEVVLRVMLSAPRSLHVESVGTLDASGTLSMTQRIDEPSKPSRTREARLIEIAPGRFAGTLSDATGPVTGTLTGDTLRLRYRIPGHLSVDQRITLAADGRSARNRSTIRRMNIVVGTITETITKLD